MTLTGADPTGVERAAHGAEGTWGSCPEHWMRVGRAVAGPDAQAPRPLTEVEQEGWDSVAADRIFHDIRKQTLHHSAWVVKHNLELAKDLNGHYRTSNNPARQAHGSL